MRRARYTVAPENGSYLEIKLIRSSVRLISLSWALSAHDPMPDKMSSFWGDDGGALEISHLSQRHTLAHHEPHLAGQAGYADGRRHYRDALGEGCRRP